MKTVGPESAHSGQKIGKIAFVVAAQDFLRVLRHDLIDHFAHPLLAGLRPIDVDELAVDAKDDGRADLEMNIGRSTLHCGGQYATKSFHRPHSTASTGE